MSTGGLLSGGGPGSMRVNCSPPVCEWLKTFPTRSSPNTNKNENPSSAFINCLRAKPSIQAAFVSHVSALSALLVCPRNTALATAMKCYSTSTVHRRLRTINQNSERHAYDQKIAKFREDEYPMLQGKWSGTRARSAVELIKQNRHNLSRQRQHHTLCQVTH